MRIMFGVVASGIDWFYEMPKGVITFPSMFLAAIASWLLWRRYRFHLGGTVLGLIGLELMILCLFLTYSSEQSSGCHPASMPVCVDLHHWYLQCRLLCLHGMEFTDAATR